MAKRKAKRPEETIGQRIRRFRKTEGLTQEELGRKVGLSKRMVAYYEIQGGSPSPELLGKFAESLGVSINTLLGREEAARRPVPASPRLWRRFKRIEELPLHQRKSVLQMIDAMANEAARRKTG